MFKDLNISYESEDLISEVKNDILEFGSDTKVIVWTKTILDREFCVNYDFKTPENPVKMEEIDEGETIQEMTLGLLLRLLEQQNQIIQE